MLGSAWWAIGCSVPWGAGLGSSLGGTELGGKRSDDVLDANMLLCNPYYIAPILEMIYVSCVAFNKSPYPRDQMMYWTLIFFQWFF